MRLIDINKGRGIKFTLYPDNQPHVNIGIIERGESVNVKCSITNSLDLMHLLECSNAIDNQMGDKDTLSIPYLMGARFDRIIQYGDSFDLKIIAKLINDLKFKTVELFDVHSDVATALIENSVNISNKKLVLACVKDNSILVCPDAGASKKINKYLEWNKCFTDVVFCNKTRDLTNGDIRLRVIEPEKCEGRSCVIIDDLCDGGGTFMAIASQIKPSSLTLIVSHGIFSRGTEIFNGVFDEIIVSDSYRQTYNSGIIKVIPTGI